MKCKKCLADIPEDAKFCPACGTDVATPTKEAGLDNQELASARVPKKRILPIVYIAGVVCICSLLGTGFILNRWHSQTSGDQTKSGIRSKGHSKRATELKRAFSEIPIQGIEAKGTSDQWLGTNLAFHFVMSDNAPAATGLTQAEGIVVFLDASGSAIDYDSWNLISNENANATVGRKDIINAVKAVIYVTNVSYWSDFDVYGQPVTDKLFGPESSANLTVDEIIELAPHWEMTLNGEWNR